MVLRLMANVLVMPETLRDFGEGVKYITPKVKNANEGAMQGHSGAAARSSGRSAGRSLRLFINPPRLQLDDRTVIFKYTGDGGWFCASFGDGAKYMDAADNDPALRRRIDARALEIKRGRDALGPDLARVMAAVELSKDYDSEQPRDEDGRWTSEGGGLGAAASAALMYGSTAYADGLQQIGAHVLGAAARALPAAATTIGDAVAAAAVPAVAFFGTLFVPTPRNLARSDGTIADAPGYSYHFDQEAGHLTIKHQLDDGTSEIVFDKRYDKDGVFRDGGGDAIGRFLGDSVALDADAVRGYEARRRSDAQAPPGAIAQTGTATRTEPKLCPDPTVESIKGRSASAILYQSQISGLPPGFDFKIVDPTEGNVVSYDACWDQKNGTLGDAKGPNYFKFMIDTNHWRDWYRGLQKLKDQMDRQSHAAPGRIVEWHFAERGPAEYFRNYVSANRALLPNVQVFYTPPLGEQ